MGPGAATDRLRCWLALNRARGLNPRTLRELLAAFEGDPCALLEARAGAGLPADAAEALRAPDWNGVERDLAWLADDRERHVLALGEPGYPPLLAETATPPPVLFVAGRPELLAAPQVAVVGSRHPTPAGTDVARMFARGLAERGLVVTSGLALGIDAAAHEGALAVDGATIAVLGTGPDQVYPRRHRALAGRIAAAGALVTEFPPGVGPRAEHFPRRNRIISGLALGVLVVEAAQRSGSLITARHALEQGREVFAVPGSIHNPLARGCHALLREGATLVESIDDVLAQVAPQLAPMRARAPAAPGVPALDAQAQRLLACIGHDPVTLDVLVSRSGLTAPEVSSMLLTLELYGYVRAHPGGVYLRGSLEEMR